MSGNFVIEENGVVRVSGTLPEAVAGKAPDLSVALRAFIAALNQVREVYGRLVADDGRLIGQERFQLLGAIEAALNTLIPVRQILAGDDDFTAFSTKYDYRLRIRIKNKRWQAIGRISTQHRLRLDDFGLWINRLTHERLAGLIRFLGQALADGKIDSKEKIVLERSVDRMIFSLLFVREGISRGEIA
ncbi:MAG: hypothetical protein H7A21_03620 [Spirochaetales bacterium]|nr:hypothetical protein [Leptospiraceae bacterium]MCP5480499.1 hypothetical protein [Spirochaetales bacterium]